MTTTVSVLFGLLLLAQFSTALHQHQSSPYLGKCSQRLAAKTSDGIQSPFDLVFQKLNFGYERPRNSTVASNLHNKVVLKQNRSLTKPSDSQPALCYPHEIRLRGCQTLITDTSKNSLVNLKLQSLPCVTDGSCPYSQFRCGKGHVWNGIIGSPVCFHCPVCESSRKVYGRKKEATADRLLKSLKLYTANRGDTLLSTTLDDSSNKWSSLVSMRCTEGHYWTGKVGNILLNKSGCLHCAISKKRCGEEEMHRTARHFDGKFLGFVDKNNNVESSIIGNNEAEAATISLRVRRALWQCSEGHVFNEIAGNIRRPPNGQRKCSWCKVCRKNGKEFEWNPGSVDKETRFTAPTTVITDLIHTQ